MNIDSIIRDIDKLIDIKAKGLSDILEKRLILCGAFEQSNSEEIINFRTMLHDVIMHSLEVHYYADILQHETYLTNDEVATIMSDIGYQGAVFNLIIGLHDFADCIGVMALNTNYKNQITDSKLACCQMPSGSQAEIIKSIKQANLHYLRLLVKDTKSDVLVSLLFDSFEYLKYLYNIKPLFENAKSTECLGNEVL